MSRYVKDHPGYRAGLELDMRQHPEGGQVQAPCQSNWAHRQPRRQTDLIVLVHGFNNNRCEAQEAYVGFRGRQRGLLARQDGQRLEDMLGDAFWPGDADFAGPLDMVDFLVYPATIQTARETAAVLRDYLLTRNDVLNLHLVGHSMGCRVILETIRLLLEADPGIQARLRKVCLMAAAVPTLAAFPGGALEAAFRAADQVLVLHSSADTVLHFAFPPGQTLAGDGFFPTAIGRHGDVPAHPGHVDVKPVEGAKHSDYWGWTATNPSGFAARFVAEFLGIAGMPRELPASGVAEWHGPESRAEVGRREVGG